jgi:hypothetical protein
MGDSHFLTSGSTRDINLANMKKVRENTIAKWDSLGFLDDLSGHIKQNIAQLYEGKASHLLNESTDEDEDGLKEDS